jgi:flavin reductase (DIM6/NTAB) family NADH-FMN oxidoreductase RutF/DNA-binding IclR family transcriptional regulator
MAEQTQGSAVIDPGLFREVMGNYPTGVVIATAMSPDGPVGITLGSFVSVSLDPPLVAIIPGKSSSTFPRIRETGSFCVNVLSDSQEHVCRTFASKSLDKFSDVSWTPAPSGAPLLEGAVAWIDCDVQEIVDAGDHYIVLGRVTSLSAGEPTLPLLFLQGGYGHFSTPSLTARPDVVVARSLPMADVARPALEALSAVVGMECTASIAAGDVMIPMLSTRAPGSRVNPPILGKRFPFVPPFGKVFAAWADDQTVLDWAARGRLDQASTEGLNRSLERIRERGWWAILRDPGFAEVEEKLGSEDLSVVSPRQVKELHKSIALLGGHYELDEYDPDDTYEVRTIAAPAFGPSGDVDLTLAIHPDRSLTGRELDAIANTLVATANVISGKLAAIQRS